MLENGFGATEETDQDFGPTDGRKTSQLFGSERSATPSFAAAAILRLGSADVNLTKVKYFIRKAKRQRLEISCPLVTKL